MSETIHSPRGTLRSRFMPTASTLHHGALLEVLQRVATEHQLDPSAMVVALELVDMEAGLNSAETTALSCLVAISLLSMQEGSTRVAVEFRGGEGDLGRKLATIDRIASESLPPHHRLLRELAVENLEFQIRHLVGGRAGRIVGRPGEFKPLILAGDHLYHQRVLICEVELAELAAGRLRRGANVGRNAALAGALHAVVAQMPLTASGQPVGLTSEQQLAVLSALHLPLSLITGGPGTGKTSTVVSILRAALRAGYDPTSIVLAAPTGKAAHRMGAAIAEHLDALPCPDPSDQLLRQRLAEPQTIHRLLGYAPQLRRYRFHRNNPLTARLVVIDEASMIDLFLMTRLMGAVPTDAHLVLIGDADQLPSVETGAVFRDLLPARLDTGAPWVGDVLGEKVAVSRSEEPTARASVRLARSFRMRQTDTAGRNVLQVAQWINTGGILGELFGPYGLMHPVEKPADLGWEGVEKLSDATTPGAFLLAWFRRWLDPRTCDRPPVTDPRPLVTRDGVLDPESQVTLEALFARHAEARLLALTRVLSTGTDNLNHALHARWLEAMGIPPGVDFEHGEPVMMVRNDYDLGLFNGDQGVVVRASALPDDPKGTLRAAFPSRTGFRLFDLHRIVAHLELAYAMTVHKSQGSEFRHIGLVLPDRDMSLLSREILYTAITRASRSVAVLGREELVLRGARRVMKRSSGLRERIRGG